MVRGAATIAAMLIAACGSTPIAGDAGGTGQPATPTLTAAPTTAQATAQATAAPTAPLTASPVAPAASTPTPRPAATPTPTPRPTAERTVTLAGTLAAKVADQERNTTGTVRIVFQLERGPAGEIVSATAQFDFALQGLPADARVQVAHVHLGTADVEGPILLDSGLTAARFRFSGGAGSVSLAAVPCDPKLAADILANPGGYHFMVHSARNPDGFVRGQLRRA